MFGNRNYPITQMGEPQYLKSTICKKGVHSIPLSASYSLACEKQGKGLRM